MMVSSPPYIIPIIPRAKIKYLCPPPERGFDNYRGWLAPRIYRLTHSRRRGRGDRKTRLARRSEKTVGPRRGFSGKLSFVGFAFSPDSDQINAGEVSNRRFLQPTPRLSQDGCQEIILAANYPNTFPDKPDFVSLFPYSRRLKY